MSLTLYNMSQHDRLHTPYIPTHPTTYPPGQSHCGLWTTARVLTGPLPQSVAIWDGAGGQVRARERDRKLSMQVQYTLCRQL